ncbi:MAG: hypothetical protein EBU84_15985 [Actinobacteria bacterium]|nr:hypothetical protein [Actinomycetota bacterium]
MRVSAVTCAQPSVTRRPLPTTTADSEQYVADLTHLTELGVTHFVMDFGHPTSTEPVMRFVDEVIKEVKRS